jgi:hypothetical protein
MFFTPEQKWVCRSWLSSINQLLKKNAEVGSRLDQRNDSLISPRIFGTVAESYSNFRTNSPYCILKFAKNGSLIQAGLLIAAPVIDNPAKRCELFTLGFHQQQHFPEIKFRQE